MNPNDTFQYGYHYMAKLLLTAQYHTSPHLYDDAYLNGVINNEKDFVSIYGHARILSASYFFDNLVFQTLSVFGVDEVVEPKAGEKPNFSSAYLYSKSCSLGNQNQYWNWYVDYSNTHGEGKTTFSENFLKAIPTDAKVMWYESEDGETWKTMIDPQTGEIASFENGKYYQVRLIVDIPDTGVQVSQWAWAYVNSKENVADFAPFTGQAGNDYEIRYVFRNLIEGQGSEDPENGEKSSGETQEVELKDLRFTVSSDWKKAETVENADKVTLIHGASSLTVESLPADQVEKSVKEGASLAEIAYQYIKSHPQVEDKLFKLEYALPVSTLNGMEIFRANGILLKPTDNSKAYSLADCSKERPFCQFVCIQLEGQYYMMYFVNPTGSFQDQVGFDQLISTLQNMKDLSIRPEGQEFSNIMGYLQAARYSYGIDEEGQKLYSNVLEIRNLNSKAINTAAVFNIYGTDENGQEYLIKEGLKLYGMVDELWWLNCGDTEITRVEFTEVTSTEAEKAVAFTMTANEDGSVITLVPEGSFTDKDVQIMLGEDQFWDYPDSGSSVTIDLSQYKDRLEAWQDYSAFTVNAVLYNK